MTGSFVTPRVILEMESTLVSAAAASGVLSRDADCLFCVMLPQICSACHSRIPAQMAHEETVLYRMRPFATNSEPSLKLIFISRIPTQVLGQQSMSCEYPDDVASGGPVCGPAK